MYELVDSLTPKFVPEHKSKDTAADTDKSIVRTSKRSMANGSMSERSMSKRSMAGFRYKNAARKKKV